MLFYYIIACATTKGKKPYKIDNYIKFQDVSTNKTFKAKIDITRIVVKKIKTCTSKDFSTCCDAITYQIFSYADEPIRFYFRFTPANNYDPNGCNLYGTNCSGSGFVGLFYQSDRNGNFIKDIAGMYPNQFRGINQTYSEMIKPYDVEPYYCTVDAVNRPIWAFNQRGNEDNVYLEISEFADFHVVYKMRLKEHMNY